MADSESEHAHLKFALALHRELAAPEADTCFSPYSAAVALSLVAKGARGETAAELSGLLANPSAPADVQDQLLRDAATLRAPSASEEAPELAVANTLWAWDQLQIEEGFREELRSWNGGLVRSAPFGDDPEAARTLINEAVSETTRELIPELLLPGSVTPDTVAALVNALYLRTGWSFPFQDSETVDTGFHAPGGLRQVPTMHQSERFLYAATQGWQLVGLPAAGGVQALVLLPDGDLAEYESSLDAETVLELMSGARETMVHLALPRVSADVRTDLTSVLRALGVRRMFDPEADLGGLSADPRLLVSDVVHQAVLRLDEQGLEGAAATAVMMRLVMMPAGDPVTVRVDRPFLLLVRHADTGAIYFLARVVRP
ncbi:serpin family protein [Amycolatopsis palatopharyngis]|uniref:serpin family protein n=1 Tax=Amycolatopsis palatopharyngis TaxID=187982 RepID=UPI000E21EE6F|nr:serpin family protein [Amycolatopsis palatopharyngis]